MVSSDRKFKFLWNGELIAMLSVAPCKEIYKLKL